MMPSVSVVIPTKNEQANIKKLLLKIILCDYEIIVVDDSDDATPEIAKSLGAKVIQGQRKGLGQAIIDGINTATGDIVLVMDADGSHSTSAIPDLLQPILKHGADLVIGSRYVKGGDFSNWALKRKIQSLIGVKLMQLVTGVSDSNSGFFAFRKSIIDGVTLKPHSWKIMLEVLFKGNWIFKKEVPIHFKDRIGGASKNSNKERLRHAIHIFKLLFYKYRHFINFAIVGGIGSIAYYILLYTLTEYVGLWYILSAIIGTLVAVTNNYLINHYWTFRYKKDTNKSLFKGWLKYLGNSAIGDGVDLCVLVLLTEVFGVWYMFSAFLASGVAAIIKYTIANKFIWKEKGSQVCNEDYEWRSYYKGLIWQKRWKQKIAKIVRDMVGDCGNVLDVGCGASPLGINTSHSHYAGVDSSYNKILYMQNKNLDNCEFQVSGCDKLPFLSNSFDTVLFIEVIEHLRSRNTATRTIKEINRVLRQGGQAIIATPNFGSWTGKMQDRLYGIFQRGGYQVEHTLKFDLEGLIKLCQDNGLIYSRSVIPMGSDMICKFVKPFKQ